MTESQANQESIRLVNRWRSGDELAAQEIYDRYVARLVALAGSRISPALARRVEPEDVVQSVYKSFFNRSTNARFQIENSGQLWGLLAAITINKVRDKARFHQAGKRNIQAEVSMSSSVSCYGLVPDELAREPTAQEATELIEQYHLAADKMGPLGKQVFQLYLENESTHAIAKQIQRSERTVRRELEQIRKLLSEALIDHPDNPTD